MKVSQDSTGGTRGRWRLRLGRFLRACLAVLVLLAFAVLVENWRGRRAWEACKRELAAKGETVDWSAYLPAQVPDAENVLKAPRMAEWFVGGLGSNELLTRLSDVSLAEFVNRRRSNAVAEVSVVAAIGPDDLKSAALILHYNCQSLSLADPKAAAAKTPVAQSPILPLIRFEEVPLTKAIEALARQEGLSYILDPKVGYGQPDEKGQIRTQPNVTFRWENLSARRALFTLLTIYHLLWIEDGQTGIGRITLRDPAEASVHVTAEARTRLLDLTRHAIRQRLDELSGPRADGSQGYTFVAGELPDPKPMRVIILAECQPDQKTVADFFPRQLGPGFAHTGNSWRAESNGSNSFCVFLDREPAYAAADYLAWSDPFQPEFDLLREALKRSQVGPATSAGDHQRPFAQPIPNFFGVRVTAQTLAQRAQCHLLLGQPEKALRELTLVNDLRRLLSAKPVSLVAAMIDVAIAGLYVETFTDGLRLQVWREPELVALQQQLGGIDLLPPGRAGFRTERAAVCQTLQVITAGEFAEYFDPTLLGGPKPSCWKRATDPAFLLLKFAPRGWVLQNIAAVARAEQLTVDIIDPDQRVVAPVKAAAAQREAKRLSDRPGPYTVLASRAVPIFVRATSTLAHNQTKADQALIACGLERYRRTHGDYPPSLEALVPPFVPQLPRDVISGQPLHYRRTTDGKFVLYSIGWNEKDDGGTVAFSTDGKTVNGLEGDWVWLYPAK